MGSAPKRQKRMINTSSNLQCKPRDFAGHGMAPTPPNPPPAQRRLRVERLLPRAAAQRRAAVAPSRRFDLEDDVRVRVAAFVSTAQVLRVLQHEHEHAAAG
eukprot:3994260-Pleurochrysis_carterae.AAC.2